MEEIIIDTETTGLDPVGGDRIIEIAAIKVIDNKITDNIFHIYLNPERNIPDSAFKVHGISGEFLSDKPVFATIADEFLNFIGDNTLVAHNAEFDLRFINTELIRTGRRPLENNEVIDTLALARRKHPGTQNSLDALCARYGVDRTRRTKHGALIDTEILAEVYLELKCGRQSSLSFSILKETRKIEPAGLLKRRNQPLIDEPTLDEVAGHARHTENLTGRSLWENYTAKAP